MFKQNLSEFFHSKTNWTGIAMMAGAIAGYLTETADPAAAAESFMLGLSLLFIRDAIAGVK